MVHAKILGIPYSTLELSFDTMEGWIHHGGDPFLPNFSHGCLDGATISSGMSITANFRNRLGSSEVI